MFGSQRSSTSEPNSEAQDEAPVQAVSVLNTISISVLMFHFSVSSLVFLSSASWSFHVLSILHVLEVSYHLLSVLHVYRDFQHFSLGLVIMFLLYTLHDFADNIFVFFSVFYYDLMKRTYYVLIFMPYHSA